MRREGTAAEIIDGPIRLWSWGPDVPEREVTAAGPLLPGTTGPVTSVCWAQRAAGRDASSALQGAVPGRARQGEATTPFQTSPIGLVGVTAKVRTALHEKA